MGFLGFWVSSYVVNNIYDLLKILSKVEECIVLPLRGEKKKIWNLEEKLCCFDCYFFILFLGSVGRRTYIVGKIWWPCLRKG
jgi:hypothetical protein